MHMGVNETAYNMLHKGMSESEVRRILGEPTERHDAKNPGNEGQFFRSSGDAHAIWQQEHDSIDVFFANGKLDEKWATINGRYRKN
jgi:hypothetical protein